MAPGFQLTQQIRFGDIDAYNHVNNVAYLQYLEDARVQLFYAELPGGSTLRGLLGPELFTLVGRHEIEYLAPISFRTDPIHVNTWVTHVGGSSFELGYTVTEADTSIIYAQAATSINRTPVDRPLLLCCALPVLQAPCWTRWGTTGRRGSSCQRSSTST